MTDTVPNITGPSQRLLSDSAPMHPAGYSAAVTPSDTTPLSFVSRGVYVGNTGNLTVVPWGNVLANPVTFPNVQAGSLLPIRVSYILNTATTASGIVIVA